MSNYKLAGMNFDTSIPGQPGHQGQPRSSVSVRTSVKPARASHLPQPIHSIHSIHSKPSNARQSKYTFLLPKGTSINPCTNLEEALFYRGTAKEIKDTNIDKARGDMLTCIILKNTYVDNCVSNPQRNLDSFYSLIDRDLSQSDAIKLGFAIEKVFRDMILTNPDLDDIREKVILESVEDTTEAEESSQADEGDAATEEASGKRKRKKNATAGVREKDHLFQSKSTGDVFYAEVKANLSLDTEKAPATIQKMKEIIIELQTKLGVSPEKIHAYLFAPRYLCIEDEVKSAEELERQSQRQSRQTKKQSAPAHAHAPSARQTQRQRQSYSQRQTQKQSDRQSQAGTKTQKTELTEEELQKAKEQAQRRFISKIRQLRKEIGDTKNINIIGVNDYLDIMGIKYRIDNEETYKHKLNYLADRMFECVQYVEPDPTVLNATAISEEFTPVKSKIPGKPVSGPEFVTPRKILGLAKLEESIAMKQLNFGESLFDQASSKQSPMRESHISSPVSAHKPNPQSVGRQISISSNVKEEQPGFERLPNN